jgi:hypothetical protein
MKLGRVERRVISDLRVVGAVVAVTLDVNGDITKDREGREILWRVELDERREVVNRMPETSDERDKQDNAQKPGDACESRSGAYRWIHG